MVATTTVTVLVLAGIAALLAPLLYLTYLSYHDESHSPSVEHAEASRAD